MLSASLTQNRPMNRVFEQFDDFCTLCGTMLPQAKEAPSTVYCTQCFAPWHVNEKYRTLVYRREKYYQQTMVQMEEKPAGADEGSVVEHVCSRCEHTLATYSTRQTRSADEGQTVFYACLKCKKTDIEYS